ncbi:hypothetical protein F5Y19DRAFT_479084 [Xylariaceae sp. FL1651]|nr:hypothetical protein F5Y19DRAFT_479084 [Xylariaceae sp. FL1651]
MKATLFTIFAIGGFIASSIANPIAVPNGVEKRQGDGDYTELNASMTSLLADIQKQTGAINATLDAMPENPTDAQTTEDATAIAPQLQAITDLLTAANAKVTKRSLLQARHGKDDLFKTVSIIIYELLYTVKKIIFKLGLGKVLIYLTPLVLSLKGLIFSLDKVVAGLLLGVKDIVNELLKAVGLGLIGIVP